MKTMRIGDDRVRVENAQRAPSAGIQERGFIHGKSVDDYAMCLNSMAAELRVLGEKMEEARIVKELTHVVPPKLEQAATSIEMLLNLDKMKVEELVGRLRVAEGKRGGEVAVVEDGHVQLEARRHQRADKERAANGNRRHDNQEDDDDRSNTCSGGSRRRRTSGKGKCFNCGVCGNFARECPEPWKDKKEALFGEVDDDEPALL